MKKLTKLRQLTDMMKIETNRAVSFSTEQIGILSGSMDFQ